MRPDPHIPDAELIMAIDGELPEPRNAQVARHLSHCWECRGRRTRLEAAIAGYMDLHQSIATQTAPLPAAGPAAQLRARLAAERLAAPPPSRPWSPWRAPAAILAGSAAALLTPLALFVWISLHNLEASGPLPDSTLTPGAVRFISKDQVCVLPAEDEGRLAPADLAQKVFQAYRIAKPTPRSYEVDYLISPALGGATAIQNLWPVPYADGVWTSRVKDALEDHLRNLVCSGKLDLATAQHEIASNWIAAYQKYFLTRTPVAEHARFVKDSPWE